MSMARAGYRTQAWDVQNGPQFDLTVPANVRRLLRVCGTASVVHLAPPCGSFSIARGASAPRSRRHPMGKPDLNPADEERVRLGNRLLLVCCKITQLLIRRGIRVSLEKPDQLPNVRLSLPGPASEAYRLPYREDSLLRIRQALAQGYDLCLLGL